MARGGPGRSPLAAAHLPGRRHAAARPLPDRPRRPNYHRRELNRRIRDDLIALGIVSAGPAVTIADGTRATPVDLIICTRNDHGVEAGEPGRTVANGDLLRSR